MNKAPKDFTLDPQASLTKCDHYRNANEESCPLRSFFSCARLFSTSRKQLFPLKTKLSCYKGDRSTYFHSSDEWIGSADEVLTKQTKKTPAEPGFDNLKEGTVAYF